MAVKVSRNVKSERIWRFFVFYGFNRGSACSKPLAMERLRRMSVEQMESESGLSVSTVKRLRAGQEASAEQIVAISVALRLPPMVSSDLLRMCGITLDFNNQRNTVYQMILTGHYKDGIEQVNVYLAACGCAPLKTAC